MFDRTQTFENKKHDPFKKKKIVIKGTLEDFSFICVYIKEGKTAIWPAPVCNDQATQRISIFGFNHQKFCCSSQLHLCWLFGAQTPPTHCYREMLECIKDTAPNNNCKFLQPENC